MEVVTRHWSGKHGRVVKGINLITRLWTEGDRHIPLDYRFMRSASMERPRYNHFRSMLTTAITSSQLNICNYTHWWLER
jgi:hypothetical protein